MNEHNNKSTAQDFFLNLGVAIALYASATSLLSLVFALINKAFPDVLSYSYFGSSDYAPRMAMAALIVVFPLFLWLSRIVTKIMQANPARREVAVRRWFVYITLFLASSALVIDLITLLNYFLSGEITARFILKVLAVIVVAGIVFWHYLGEVRGKNTPQTFNAVIGISSVIVLAALVASFVSFGSPMNTRKMRIDSMRVGDLQSMQWQILNQYQQKGAVPATLDDLKDPISSYMVPKDPETGKAYGYQKISKTQFKLCATFALASESENPSYEFSKPMGSEDNWSHPAGDHCFDRTIDPALYPIFSNNPSVFPNRGL